MKKTAVTALVLIVLILPLLALGCAAATPTPVPARNGGQEAVVIEITGDQFTADPHMTREADLVRPGSLIVSLGSNRTTGFQWADKAAISDASVIEQQSHSYVEPATGASPLVGAAGKEVWVFNSLKAGTSTIDLSYSRPWEGGEKNVWTLTLKVTVK